MVFQLLIYLLLTTKPLVLLSTLEIKRPAIDETIVVPPPPIPMVEIMVLQGDYAICGKHVSAGGVGGVLHQLARVDTNQTIIVKCSPDSAHERLMGILDLCNQEDLRNISVMSM